MRTRWLPAFMAVVGVMSCAANEDRSDNFVVKGTVVRGPVCPPAQTTVAACEEAPAAGAAVRVIESSKVVASATTDATGAFTVRLARGTYTLEGSLTGSFEANPVGGVARTELVVPLAGDRPLVLRIDTGIR